MSTIPFVCKNCGSTTFKVTSKPESLGDIDGATCEKCGTELTKEEIKSQARRIALEALKKAGLKIK
jgi:predicted Zn-ribbon and HTH transcriptional regulator